jgi:hypothetical protein
MPPTLCQVWKDQQYQVAVAQEGLEAMDAATRDPRRRQSRRCGAVRVVHGHGAGTKSIQLVCVVCCRPTSMFGAGVAATLKSYRVGAVRAVAFCDEVRALIMGVWGGGGGEEQGRPVWYVNRPRRR